MKRSTPRFEQNGAPRRAVLENREPLDFDYQMKCRPRAADRKTAISPLVMGEFGQKLPPPHPPVIPDEANASMYWKAQWSVGTSANVAVPGAGET
jgi:hypothetical protein